MHGCWHGQQSTENNVMLLVGQLSEEYEQLAADGDPEYSSMPLPLTHPLDFVN